MAGVCSSNLTDLKLANIAAQQVTSRTRFTWSEREVAVFETFVRYKHIHDTRPSRISAVEIQPLMADLNLDRFLSIANDQGDQLGPIIETKVRRKLAAVATDLQATEHVDKSVLPEKTRLQTARARAIAAGEEPPARLPKPNIIYTPELWKSKPKPKHSKRVGAGARSGTAAILVVPTTVEEAQQQIHQLEEALESARLRLSQLQQEAQFEAQLPQELEEARLDRQKQPQQHRQQKKKTKGEEEMRKGRHGAGLKIGMEPQAEDEVIDEVSSSESDAVDSDFDSDPKHDPNPNPRSSQHRAVAPILPPPLGSNTPQTIVPTSRKALLTLGDTRSKMAQPNHQTDSTTKTSTPAKIPRTRRFRTDRTLASLAKDGVGAGDDVDEDELDARLRNISDHLKANLKVKYGKAG